MILKSYDFEVLESGLYYWENEIFKKLKFTTVESILPDRPIRNGSRSGGLRQNLVRVSVPKNDTSPLP